jgi:hypothetical protein
MVQWGLDRDIFLTCSLENEMRYVTSREVSNISGKSYRETLHHAFLVNKGLALLNYAGLFFISFLGLLFPTMWLDTSSVFLAWGVCILFIAMVSIVLVGCVLNPLVLKCLKREPGQSLKNDIP